LSAIASVAREPKPKSFVQIEKFKITEILKN